MIANQSCQLESMELFHFETRWPFDGGNAMRAAIFLLGIFLFLSASANAQGPVGVGTGPEYAPIPQHESEPWQIAIGYQYNRDNLLGTPFNTHGVNVDFARYFGRWIAVEAGVGVGFLGNTGQSSTPPNLSAKSLFAGAGPRLRYRNRSRYEPWIHALVGIEHFRFSQTAGVLGSNSALAGPAGGGLDVYVTRQIAFRVEADAFYSRFFQTNQRSFQVVGGLAYNF